MANKAKKKITKSAKSSQMPAVTKMMTAGKMGTADMMMTANVMKQMHK